MPATLFVVRRKLNWAYPLDDIPWPEDQYSSAFDSREAAEECARRRDREAWSSLDVQEFNPFASLNYEQLTSFPPFALRDWLRDAGIEPPPMPPKKFAHREQQIWSEWWTQQSATWGERERVRVWEGLNLHRVYEVVEVPTGEADVRPADLVVFAVVHRDWQYMDNWYKGSNDACGVFRTRQRAEQELRRLEEEHRADPEFGYRQSGPDEFVIVEMLIAPED